MRTATQDENELLYREALNAARAGLSEPEIMAHLREVMPDVAPDIFGFLVALAMRDADAGRRA